MLLYVWTILKTFINLPETEKFEKVPKKSIFDKRGVSAHKSTISQLWIDFQGSTTPSNEPELSHYGRRSMVSEPYLDRKKSYEPLKFLDPLCLVT